MSKFKVLLALTFLASCDVGQKLIDAPSDVAKHILRIDEREDARSEKEQNESIKDLENRIAKLEEVDRLHQELLDLAYTNINANAAAIEQLDFIIQDLQNQLDNLEIAIYDEIQNLESLITDLQSQINRLRAAVQTGIAEVIDPCGDGPGFDEVVLRLADDSIIAYFQQGSRRMLAVLPNGFYRTTDQQRCRFEVRNGEII